MTQPLLEHPIDNPRYTQQYGERPATYGGRGHMGVDYGMVTGTPVHTTADGIVDKSGTDPGGYGEYVRVWHPALRAYTLYGHFSQRKVSVGDVVKQGDTIGLSGNTGNSTGPHLHYEIRIADGKDQWVTVPGFKYSQVDPVSFYHGFVRALPPPPPPPPPADGTTTVNGTNVRVRSGPGTSNKILGKFSTGATGKAVGRNQAGTWVQVEMPGLNGWMSADYLDVVGGVAALPVTDGVVTPPPTGTGGDKFERSLDFVKRWEGGWADNPADPGGATMKGITIGTYTRWRAAHGQSAPTKAMLKAITDEEVAQIYKEWYWEASGADKMEWPMCLAQFDLAVNGGPGRAAQALAAVGPNFDKYMTWRENWYRTLSGFPTFGTAWLRRCKDLRAEAVK